jgi:hypothetical protein
MDTIILFGPCFAWYIHSLLLMRCIENKRNSHICLKYFNWFVRVAFGFGIVYLLWVYKFVNSGVLPELFSYFLINLCLYVIASPRRVD